MKYTKSLREQAKDIATLKTAKENFFKDDGNLMNLFQHGSLELANMLLHGHPAPVYGGYASPADQFGLTTREVDGKQNHEQASATQAIEMPTQSSDVSFVDQTMHELHQQAEMQEPELEIEH